jgi:putative redox protein
MANTPADTPATPTTIAATTSTPTTTATTVHHLVDKRFVGITPDGMRVIIDGESEHKAGMNPMQLVLNGLAACAAFDVVAMITKRRLEVRAYRVEASGDRRGAAPRSFLRVHTRHVLDVPGLDRAMAVRFVELAVGKYCSVAASLTAEHTFEVVMEGDAATAEPADGTDRATDGPASAPADGPADAPADGPAVRSRH